MFLQLLFLEVPRWFINTQTWQSCKWKHTFKQINNVIYCYCAFRTIAIGYPAQYICTVKIPQREAVFTLNPLLGFVIWQTRRIGSLRIAPGISWDKLGMDVLPIVRCLGLTHCTHMDNIQYPLPKAFWKIWFEFSVSLDFSEVLSFYAVVLILPFPVFKTMHSKPCISQTQSDWDIK